MNKYMYLLGKTVQWGKQEPLVYQHRDQKFIFAIDRAYSEAARTLLEVLIQENDLMGRLRSVKNYFLLAQGDFVVKIIIFQYALKTINK
jgi:gamma-tubulin complex component 2